MRQYTKTLGALTLLLCCTVVLSGIFGRLDRGLALTTDKTPNEGAIIILDAGHGGEDAGAIGTNGVLEKDLNLSLVQTLAALLRGAGYTVVETRTEDQLLYSPDTKKGHKKQSDLENRLAFTDLYPNSVLISIHMNTFPNSTCQGVQVWYSQNRAESAALAAGVQSKVKALLQSENNRKTKAATSSIFLLRHARVPAILVECGFLSTPAECERLCDETYRKMLALCLFEAICEKIPPRTCEI